MSIRIQIAGQTIQLQLYFGRVPRRPPAVYFPHYEEHFDCFVDSAGVLFVPGFEERLSRRALIVGAVRRFAGVDGVTEFKKQIEQQGGWPAVDSLQSEGMEPTEPGQPRRVPLDD